MTMTATGMTAFGQTAAHFDMELSGGNITEKVSNKTYAVASALPATTITGVEGQALRFDGYSNYVRAGLPVASLSTSALTMSVVLAAETYPMMQTDAAEDTPTYATVCGNLDESGKKGFALELSSQGDLRLRLYVNYGGGYLITIDGSKKLPRGQWNTVAMTFDKTGNAINLYLNGESIGSKKSNKCDLIVGDQDFWIGKGATDIKSGPFLLNTFCGAIDDIVFYNGNGNGNVNGNGNGNVNGNVADFNYPVSRYVGDPSSLRALWRPLFHGMPSGSWTNESHGMLFSDGRYHVFFQKNANGPYMSRLHWGHISSANLYDWREEPIAVYPGETFDIKGCWSGCVYEDGSTPTLLYTAVDNGKARIAQAKAQDNGLNVWGDKHVVIDGRPAGLSDDFRDPYFFEANGQKYIIVGTSKNGVGACTLHKWQNGAWTNDGAIFFQGGSASQHGRFWEMPNVTPMGGGKWLFTCTPLETSVGVRTLCWVGTIDGDGKFTPDANGVQYLEMGGVSRDGYGLLSPTIYHHNGKTLLMGIVPDKLPGQRNYEMGWAHNFSLPREVSLAADGTLVQRPYSGLANMRTSTAVTKQQTIIGVESLSPVSGRQIELYGEFTVTSGTCGFQFLKSGNSYAELGYNVATGELKLNASTLSQQSNGQTSWSVMLPKKVVSGEKLTLDVFVDGSIVDVFVNNTWAFSERLFPTNVNAVETAVFATASTDINASAWVLDAKQDHPTGISAVQGDRRDGGSDKWFTLDGRQVSSVRQTASNGQPKRIIIGNGRKFVTGLSR